MDTPNAVAPGLKDVSFGTDGSHNYCRNPDGKSDIYCFLADSSGFELCAPVRDL